MDWLQQSTATIRSSYSMYILELAIFCITYGGERLTLNADTAWSEVSILVNLGGCIGAYIQYKSSAYVWRTINYISLPTASPARNKENIYCGMNSSQDTTISSKVFSTRQVTRATHVRNRVCPRVEY